MTTAINFPVEDARSWKRARPEPGSKQNTEILNSQPRVSGAHPV